ALPNAADRLILPGSRRVRTFDFARGRTRVHVLSGCSPNSTLREIELRGQGRPNVRQVGPFPRLLEQDAQRGWYEEEILEGWCLARLPPWFDRARLLRQALSELDRFAAPSRVEVAAHAWVDERRAWFAEQLAEEQPRMAKSLPQATLDCLAELASEGPRLRVQLAHGDLQEGNVFALREGGVLILDWEFSHLSFAEYDRLVLGLWMRSGGNILARLRAFVHGEDAHLALAGLPCGYPERRRLVARLLLEELRFFLVESGARDDGYSQGLQAVFQAAQGFVDAVMQERL
ncbi:MAG TPA: hypothetical protein VFQ61_10810, partial [Polyangiaceae bacterium]|nr:hypothetical protein [Polyangiaceae bacterium]